MSKIIIALFLTSTFSCSQQKVIEQVNADTAATPLVNGLNKYFTDSTNNFIQRDSLIIVWSDNLTNSTTTDLNFHSEKKPQLNQYVDGQIDTIEQLTFKESNLLIYHTIDKKILMSSDIRNPEIPLSNEIKVGLSRIELLKALNTESNRDTITVTDFENNTNFTLILKNNLLSRIIYYGYIE